MALMGPANIYCLRFSVWLFSHSSCHLCGPPALMPPVCVPAPPPPPPFAPAVLTPWLLPFPLFRPSSLASLQEVSLDHQTFLEAITEGLDHMS